MTISRHWLAYVLGFTNLAAHAQLTPTSSLLTSVATADGVTSSASGHLRTQAMQPGMSSHAATSGTLELSDGIRISGASYAQRTYSNALTSAGTKGYVEFTLASVSDLRLTLSVRWANAKRGDTNNLVSTTVSSESGALANISLEHPLGGTLQSRSLFNLPSGRYRIDFDWTAYVTEGIVETYADINHTIDLTATPVPEPASMTVLTLGLVALRRRRLRQAD